MIRTALIGLGKMGISHLAIFRAHPEVQVVAVCDQSKYLLDIVRKFANLRTYSDYTALFDTEQLDAVVVATPTNLHAEVVRAALIRSLHIFCEKPFCLDPAEGRELARLAVAKRVVNQVGYHYRFVGTFSKFRSLIESGTIGKLHHIHAEAYGPVVLRSKGRTWRAKKSEGGGCLYDYASHAVDLMNFLLGPPSEIKGTVMNRIFSEGVDDEVYSIFTYNDHLSGRLSANWSDESYRKMFLRVSLWGDGGTIQANSQEIRIFIRDKSNAKRNHLEKGWNVHYATELTNGVWYFLRGEEYSHQIDHFVQNIVNGSLDNISSFESATEADRTIALMVQNANKGNTQ